MPTMSIEQIGQGQPPPPAATVPGDRCAQCSAINVPLLACDDTDDPQRKNTNSKPRYCNSCMIGKKVRVFWPVDERWYTGKVQEYDATTGEHLLCYNDGDTEWVKIGETNTTGGSGVVGGVGSNPNDPLAPINAADSLDSFNKGENMNLAGHPPQDPSGQAPAPGMNERKWQGPGGEVYYGGPFPPSAGPMGYTVAAAGGIAMGYGPMPPPPPHMGPPGHYTLYAPYGGPFPHGYGGPPPGIGGDMTNKTDEPSAPTAAIDASGNNSSGGGKRKTGPKAWTKEEDALLLNIVHSMQWPMKWTIVAQSLLDRTGKQCRERYVNHLNPRLKVTDWTPVEDATIFHLYNTMGSHWAKMSKAIPGRTDNGIKNRFHNIRRQYEREDEHRLRLSSAEDFPEEIRLDRLRQFPEEFLGKSKELWDMKSAVGVLAAQSVLGSNANRQNNRFGPFREAKMGDMCVRCGFLVPSVQTGSEICTKSGWCQSCTRVPPHVSGHLLRECLNLRRDQDRDRRAVIEAWPGNVAGDNDESSALAPAE